MRTRQWLKAIRYVSYRIMVAGEMVIGFSANRVQQASYPMPHSHKSRGEFGIREIRYVNYRVAVGLLVGPKRCILSFKAVGLGLFTFELSV